MRRRLLISSVVVAILIIVTAVAMRIRNTPDPAATPLPPATTIPTSTQVATTTPACGTVAATNREGAPLPEAVRQQVTAVHDAACRRDIRTLQALMDSGFGGRSSAEGAAALAVRDGQPMALLAEALETPAIVTQGGFVFCHPDGPAAVFSRGTPSMPGTWSDFSRATLVTKPCHS